MTKVRPVHPGEILLEEFLSPLVLTKNKLAFDIKVPASRVDQIVKGNRSISADTALRLSRYFGTSASFWLNLQSAFDLAVAERTSLPEIRKSVHRYVPPPPAVPRESARR
ncbi:MAG TPA: HigA family addiction module antitoxin [Bryobacteraceae bacterium]|nr:HigA family addiction module antitoxin [Bryobacteraceae bacterium]